jgi:site-specific recombinase XerD
VIADGEALYAALESERQGRPSMARINTLPWLIQSFEQQLKNTPRERPVSKSTIENYAYFGRVVTEWSAEAGHPHIKSINRPAGLKFLATMNDTPTKRRHVAGYLRQLMFHAMDLGLRTDNPFVKIRTEAPKAKVHIWSDAELEKMVETADKLKLRAVGTAMLIAHDEGPRPCDVLAFERKAEVVSGRADQKTERGHYTPSDGAFRYFQQKTDGWVVSPAGQRVRGRLAEQPVLQRPLVMNPRTLKPYNERVFLKDFHKVKKAAGMAHLQFRHLRHTFCVKAKRADLDPIQIASKTGHDPKSVEDMLRKYYLPHDSEVATQATAQLEAHRNRSRTP